MFSELNVVVERMSARSRCSGSLLRPPHLDRGHCLALKIHTRWIKRDLGADPIVGVLTEHQRERGEVCFVDDKPLWGFFKTQESASRVFTPSFSNSTLSIDLIVTTISLWKSVALKYFGVLVP